jgi:hypothetical protein
MAEDGIRFEGVRREYDWEQTTPTFAVLESIAVFKHGNPNLAKDVLDTPLNDYIDGDGLDKVVRSPASVTIEFTAASYDVRISGNQVTVTAADSNWLHSR